MELVLCLTKRIPFWDRSIFCDLHKFADVILKMADTRNKARRNFPGCFLYLGYPGVEIWNTTAVLSGNLGCAAGGAQKVTPAPVFGLVHQVSGSELHVQFCDVCVVVMSLFKEFHRAHMQLPCVNRACFL